jgi:integrase
MPPHVLQGFSKQYVATLWRLTPILAGKPSRWEFFTEVAQALEWSPTTQSSYWGAVMTLLKLLEMLHPADRSLMKKLEERAAQAATWSTDSPSQMLTQDRVDEIAAVAMKCDVRAPERAAYLALMLGQRVGDVLTLRPSETYLCAGRVAITFIEGKTVARTGAFTLTVPSGTDAATILRQAAEAAMLDPRDRLFLPTSRAEAEQKIHRTFPALDLRALRRTGLSRLALSGCKVEILLQISRHTSIRMLEVYLRRGLLHGMLANEMASAFATAWETPYLLPIRIGMPPPP